MILINILIELVWYRLLVYRNVTDDIINKTVSARQCKKITIGFQITFCKHVLNVIHKHSLSENVSFLVNKLFIHKLGSFNSGFFFSETN